MAQVAKWQKEPFDKETQEKVTALLNNPKALEDAFIPTCHLGLEECAASWALVPIE